VFAMTRVMTTASPSRGVVAVLILGGEFIRVASRPRRRRR
jgi:hypothetical protein